MFLDNLFRILKQQILKTKQILLKTDKIFFLDAFYAFHLYYLVSYFFLDASYLFHLYYLAS